MSLGLGRGIFWLDRDGCEFFIGEWGERGRVKR